MEQYERLKILGVGSFGKVYLMRHRQQRRLVCAKIIRVKNIPRKEREACRTEVRLARRILPEHGIHGSIQNFVPMPLLLRQTESYS